MSDSSPARVSCEVDAIAASTGRVTIRVDAPLSFLNNGDAAATLAALGGAGGAWGSITGSLSAQTDLVSALAGKQAAAANLTALGGLAGAADKLPYFTGPGAIAMADLTYFSRILLGQTNEGGWRSNLSLGSAAILDAGTSPGNLVPLDEAGKLPAVDGSQLTNLPGGGAYDPTAVAITGGTIDGVTIGGTAPATGNFGNLNIGANAGDYYQLGNRVVFQVQSDGVLSLFGGAFGAFDRLQFGGTTASFPALKRSGATVQVRLADDSDYAGLRAGNTVLNTLATNVVTTPLVEVQPIGVPAVNTIYSDGTHLYWRDAGGTDHQLDN